MDGAATHCLTARPLHPAAPRRHPPKRQRSTVEGFLEASATAFFVLGLPVVAAAIALAGARYVPETRRRELLAALLVHGASTGLVALPLAVCGLHGYHRRTSALHQLCATHLVWNAHLVAPGLSFYPFLVESFLLRSDPGTHAGVLRDTTSYFVWCCAPLVLRRARSRASRRGGASASAGGTALDWAARAFWCLRCTCGRSALRRRCRRRSRRRWPSISTRRRRIYRRSRKRTGRRSRARASGRRCGSG